MSQATSVTFSGWPAWNAAARDVYEGAVATVRLIVSFSGVLALALGAVVLANDEARGALRALLPNPVAYAIERPVETALQSATETETAAPAAAADPRQKHVVQYLSRRYRVAEEATRLLVATAFEAGREHRIDPLLILSVVAIESSLNPFAESAMGAQGLMQVMTRVHAERFEAHGGQLAALDPVANMKVGTAILADLIARGGSVERGLQLYVGAGNLPDDGGYGARVLGERSRLALASTGKVDAAIAAGRAAAAEPKAPVEAAVPTVPHAVPTAAQPVAAPARDA
jgi:soluble lytic murein transglycosylase-like protein